MAAFAVLFFGGCGKKSDEVPQQKRIAVECHLGTESLVTYEEAEKAAEDEAFPKDGCWSIQPYPQSIVVPHSDGNLHIIGIDKGKIDALATASYLAYECPELCFKTIQIRGNENER